MVKFRVFPSQSSLLPCHQLLLKEIIEWKIGWDQPNDEHRHLSQLVGWYPGYSISTNMWNKTVTDAVNVTLTARGNGTSDSNTGWEKVWRVACWARLGNTDIA